MLSSLQIMAFRRAILLVFVAFLVESQGTRLKDWLDNHPSPERAGQDVNPSSPTSTGTDQSRAGNTRDNTEDCLKTQQKFVNLSIGDPSLTIRTKTHDSDMDICYKGYSELRKQSCCTRTMERQYEQAAMRDFYQVLQSSSDYLLHLLKDNGLHYQDMFTQLLDGAHNKTDKLFSDVYHLPLMDRWGPTQSLFLDLHAYLRQIDVSIHTSVETFFDELFPLVFHNNVNDPRASELNDEYRECLMGIRKDIYPPPFGGIPGKLAHQLSKSFGSARVFLDALKLAFKTINITSHVPLDQSCKDALTRLEFCGHCEGHTETAPCKGFCYNVMRGCFVHITEANVHWNEFIDALELMVVNMRGVYDIENALQSFHTKVSEAIMHAMETGVKFSRKVVERCGHPKSRKSDQTENARGSPSSQSSIMLPVPGEPTTKLHTKMEVFMRNVIAAKGFLTHMPEVMCTEERFSASLDAACWNGQDVSPYNQSIMAKDLSAQEKNPEVRILPNPPLIIKDLTDQLLTMKKLLSSKANLEQMQGDAAAAPGSPSDNSYYYGPSESTDSTYDGSGWYAKKPGGYYRDDLYGYPPDDDDWDSYSGSGSGSGPIRDKWPNINPADPDKKKAYGMIPDPDLNFDTTESHENEFLPPGGTGCKVTSTVMVLLVALVVCKLV